MLGMQAQETVDDSRNLLAVPLEQSEHQRPYRSQKEQELIGKRAKKIMDLAEVIDTDDEDDEAFTGSGASVVPLCNYPAPLVVNGAAYCGCQLLLDHEGVHEIRVTWKR